MKRRIERERRKSTGTKNRKRRRKITALTNWETMVAVITLEPCSPLFTITSLALYIKAAVIARISIMILRIPCNLQVSGQGNRTRIGSWILPVKRNLLRQGRDSGRETPPRRFESGE